MQALVEFYMTHDRPSDVSELLNKALAIAPNDSDVLDM